MELRQLGEFKTSPMGIGCWAIGGLAWNLEKEPLGWGQVDDQESIKAIHAAMAADINFIDTADVYGAGHSERVVSKAIQGKREQIILATKVGVTFQENEKIIEGMNASPEYIREACHASLKRLKTDYIDLLQFHLNDYPTEQAIDVRETFEQLVYEGKIRAYGWSTDHTDRASLFLKGRHCAAIQHEYNLMSYNDEMISLCEHHQIASIARAPLAMGLLTGKYRKSKPVKGQDIRNSSVEWIKYFRNGVPHPKYLKKLAAVKDILTSGGRTLSQGALAWAWAKSPNNIVIPGFKTVDQIESNIEAMKYGPLTYRQIREIEQIME